MDTYHNREHGFFSTYHRLQELHSVPQKLEKLLGIALPLTADDFNRRLELANALSIPHWHPDFAQKQYNERGLPKTREDYSRMIHDAYYQGVEIPGVVRAYTRHAANIPAIEEVWFLGSGRPLEPELKKPEDASSEIEAATLSIINSMRGRKMDVDLYVVVGKSADFPAFIEEALYIKDGVFAETHQEVLNTRYIPTGYLTDPLSYLEEILCGAICVYPKD